MEQCLLVLENEKVILFEGCMKSIPKIMKKERVHTIKILAPNDVVNVIRKRGKEIKKEKLFNELWKMSKVKITRNDEKYVITYNDKVIKVLSDNEIKNVTKRPLEYINSLTGDEIWEHQLFIFRRI